MGYADIKNVDFVRKLYTAKYMRFFNDPKDCVQHVIFLSNS